MYLNSKKRFIEQFSEIDKKPFLIVINDIIKKEKSYDNKIKYLELEGLIKEIKKELNGAKATSENIETIYSKLEPKYIKRMNKEMLDYGFGLAKL